MLLHYCFRCHCRLEVERSGTRRRGFGCPEATSISALTRAISARSSDTLKKRLGLTITSEKAEDGVRQYRVC